MNENQHYTEEEQERAAEGRQVQQELERQLRAFGETMSDAFRFGFEGQGETIGNSAYHVGRAAVDAANFGIGEAVKALRTERDERARARRKDGAAARISPRQETAMPQWACQIFGIKREKEPVKELRESARKCRSGGSALLVVGITFAAIFGLGGIGCLAAASSFVPQIGSVLEGVAMTGDLMYGTAEALGAVGSMALSGLQFAGVVLSAIALGFGAMIAAGVRRMRAGRQLELCADLADGFDYHTGLSLEMLANLTDQKKKTLIRNLRRFIRKGWLSAWLDEKAEMLYLTAEDYRAAQQRTVPQPEAQPTAAEPDKKAEVPLNLETARSFAAVLAREKEWMQDVQAAEELEHMYRTTTAICGWLETHPESLPKVRRFAEYYIPTTLKLLHTYNDVQGQQGENAETIRRDIAGILHTLNQAYDNLYDKLLSEVAMDVSSEIAALEGMLASDGLAGEELL